MAETPKTPWSIKEEPSHQLSDVFESIEIDELIKQTKNEIDLISERVFSGEITILESTTEMGKLTRTVLKKISDEFASLLKVETNKLPFAIFVFGATARNQMLPNSDLDICLVFENSCPEKIKSLLKENISLLPFNDEVDIAHQDLIESMKKENCPSLMEYNKVIESRFVAGNTNIAEQHAKLINDQDSQTDKERRFITEYGLLHRFDYQSRSSEHGPNLKYDFGASRDIVFLDWYYLLKNTGEAPPEDRPTSFACLDLLVENKKITAAESEEIKSGLELILLTKFALWSKNSKSNDKKFLYLSDYSLDAAYKDIKKILEKENINGATEFIQAYHKAKSRLHIAVKKLFLEVAASNQNLVEIWEMAKEKKELDNEVLTILEHSGWDELVPFAVNSKSPEILHYLVKKLAQLEGYEYILRIISENKYINDNVKQDLLNSRLDARFKQKILGKN